MTTVCAACHRPLDGSPCGLASLAIGAQTFDRVPLGRETWRAEARSLEAQAARCPSCGVERGAVHHYHCPHEECPRCGGQLVSCGCREDAAH